MFACFWHMLVLRLNMICACLLMHVLAWRLHMGEHVDQRHFKPSSPGYWSQDFMINYVLSF